jgi:hypothetical protein
MLVVVAEDEAGAAGGQLCLSDFKVLSVENLSKTVENLLCKLLGVPRGLGKAFLEEVRLPLVSAV